MDKQLQLIDRGPWDVFTTGDASRVGLGSFRLVELARAAVIDHLGRGLFALHPAEPLSAEDAHRRLTAGIARLHPDAVLICRSAVVAHGLPVFDVDLDRALIARPVVAERVAQHWTTRPQVDWLDPVDTDAGPAARIAAAVVLHALEDGPIAGIVALDRALHDARVDIAEVEELAELVTRWPKSSHVRTMLAYADGRSESVGESRTRVELAMAGIEVEPQSEVTDEAGRFVARVDLRVKGSKVVLEFDGLQKYRGEDGTEALIAEKRREDELRRLGYVVVRFTWADLYVPGKVVARVRAALATARAAA
jgi:very-short-patch-repair endonuclease